MSRLTRRVGVLCAPLSDRSIRQLWYARLVSTAGDWAARIALSLLLYDRTGSPLAATAVYVVSLLPHVGIGQVLATLADRFPHRTVMAVSDVVRGVLFLVVAAVPMPMPAVLALAFVAGLADPPFFAAHAAAMPQLAGDRYLPAQTLFAATSQAMNLLGFAVGGLLAAVSSPATALALNGASFLFSLVFVVRIRTTRSSESGARGPLIRPAVRALTSDPLIVVSAAVVTAGTVLGASVESLMVPFATHLGIGPAGTGLLATVPPLAAMVGAFLLPSSGAHSGLVRLVCRTVAVLSVSAVAIFALDGPLAFVLVGFLIAGALDVMTVPAGVVIGERLPQASRGTAFSFLEGTLKVTNVVAAVVAGGLATAVTVPMATAAMAVPGIAAAVAGLLLVRRSRVAAGPSPLAGDAVPALAD